VPNNSQYCVTGQYLVKCVPTTFLPETDIEKC
jgi:hypothetical protein